MPRDLVLLHGFTNTGACWGPVLAAAGERYRALAPDIRGHGSASAARPVTLAAVLDDIAPTDILVGYSMGGRIALHAALAGRAQRLILLSASPGIADDSERARRRDEDEELAARVERWSIEEFAGRWAQTPILAGLTPELAAQAHADRLRSTPAGLAAALRGLGTGALPPLWDRLHELTIPVTLIVGERDSKFVAIARQMVEALPDARVVVVAGAGHAVHLEHPAAVARELVE